MTKKSAAAPRGLSKAAQRWWRELQADYPLTDAAGALLLEDALRHYDRATEARRLIDAQGAILADRFGQPILNPAVRVERDSTHAMRQALRQLNLDIAPARPPGRPLGS